MKRHVALPIAAIVLLGLGAIGCDREGPAERAGERLDRGVEKAGDSIERSGNRTRDELRR